jgi:ribose 5-phosphate isomerase B
MKILFGSDHAGFELKNKLIEYAKSLGHEVVDKGAFEMSKDDDYPDFIAPVAREVMSDPLHSRGVVLGGSGQGEAIAANRFMGVRAAVYYGGSLELVKLSREHNDANVLSFGTRFISEDEAKTALKLWLETSFSGEKRHARRNKKLDSGSWGVCALQ